MTMAYPDQDEWKHVHQQRQSRVLQKEGSHARCGDDDGYHVFGCRAFGECFVAQNRGGGGHDDGWLMLLLTPKKKNISFPSKNK